MVKKFGLIKNTKYLLAVLSLTSAFYGKAGAQTTEEDYQQGLKYLVAGNVQESVRLFKKALQLKKKFWEAYQSLGNAYEKLGLMDDALDNYNKSLKLNPQNETLQLLASGLKADQESILPDKGVRFIPPIKPDSKLEVNLFYSFPGWLGTPADANVWNQTMGFGLWIGYALDRRFLLGARFNYYLYSPNSLAFIGKYGNDHFSSATFTGSGSIQVEEAIPSLKVNIVTEPGPFQPYVFGGMGIMNKSFDETTIKGQDLYGNPLTTVVPGYAQNNFVVNFGLGVPFQINDLVSVTAEYEGNFGFTDQQSTIFGALSFGASIKF